MEDWYINSYGSAIHVSMASSIRIKRNASKWQVWAYFYSVDGNWEDASIDADFLMEKDTQEECIVFIEDLINGDI